jgi:hypothetical protein
MKFDIWQLLVLKIFMKCPRIYGDTMEFCNGKYANIKWVSMLALNDVIPSGTTLITTQALHTKHL